MTEIINLKTGKLHQEKEENTQEVKEERSNTIAFLKEIIGVLEKEDLDPKDCIVMVGYEDNRDKLFNSESHDIFHTDNSTREILGLIELVKHHYINDRDKT